MINPGLPIHYEALGVSEDATPEEIKAAHRKMIRDYHPDQFDASEKEWIRTEAARHTRVANAAYDVLKNPETRAAYDRELSLMREPAGDESDWVTEPEPPDPDPSEDHVEDLWDEWEDEQEQAEAQGSSREDEGYVPDNGDHDPEDGTYPEDGGDPQSGDGGLSWAALRPRASLDWFARDLDPRVHVVAAYSVWGCLLFGILLARGPAPSSGFPVIGTYLLIAVVGFFLSRVVRGGLMGAVAHGAWLGPVGVLGAGLILSLVNGVLGLIPLIGPLIVLMIDLAFLVFVLALVIWLLAWVAVFLRGTVRLVR